MEVEIAAKLATSLLNIDSSKVHQPSLHERKKGYTEVWGIDEINDAIQQQQQQQQQEQKQPKSQQQSNKAPLLILTQHRVAYLEQLYLRIFNIPHLVQNSPYICTEHTGPLPYLKDLTCNNSVENSNSNFIPPALVGRNHPKHTNLQSTTHQKTTYHDFIPMHILDTNDPIYMNNISDIITYLQISHHDAKLKTTLYDDSNSTMNENYSNSNDNDDTEDDYLLRSLILETLQPILEYRRHCCGNSLMVSNTTTPESLYQLYMKASSMHAALMDDDTTTSTTTTATTTLTDNTTDATVFPSWYTTYSNNALFHPLAAFQYWSMKVISQRNSMYWKKKHWTNFSKSDPQMEGGIFIHGTTPWSHSNHQSQDMTKLLLTVKKAYTCLEEFVSKSNDDLSSSSSTSTPTLLQVLLYSHLCEAIVDPEFLFVLSAFPNLLQFFKLIHIRYFGEGYTGRNGSPNSSGSTTTTDAKVEDWVTHNNQMNQNNVFHPTWMFSNSNDYNNDDGNNDDDDNEGSPQPRLLKVIQEMADAAFQSNNTTAESKKQANGVPNLHYQTRMEQVEEYIQLFAIQKSHPNPANTFHRVRHGGPLFSKSKVNPERNLKKDNNEEKEEEEESFGGYLSSKYLNDKKRWYYRFINPSEYLDVNDEINAGNTQGRSGNNNRDGEQWMKAQKKIALENDQKWMGLVLGLVGVAFMMTTVEGPDSK